MPIRRENRDRYPGNWKAISDRIRFRRARGRCECTGQCGKEHRVQVIHCRGQGAAVEELAREIEPRRCFAMHGQDHPRTKSKVVLTVAHLDHTPENCGDDNLLAMCQACHLAYDAEHHAASRRAARS